MPHYNSHMNYLDLKYTRLVSSYLPGWKEVSQTLSRFRCPFCGDSNKSQTKTRGYFYEIDGSANFKCHNCGASMGLYSFLKEVAPTLAREYTFEKFRNTSPVKENPLEKFIEKPSFPDKGLLDKCPTIASLDDDHKARAYIKGRLIPEKFWSDLYYCKDIRDIANQLPEYKERELPKNDAIIIPFYNEERRLVYLQARFFGDVSVRYLTLIIDSSAKKLWGLDRVDWNKKVYVCEGPFDAMFVENCIAVAGASIMSEIKYLREHAKHDLVLIFDKDYQTNPEVYGQFLKAVNQGIKVIMFDAQFAAKDINAQVQNGTTIPDLQKYLERRTFSGLGAKLELTKVRPPLKRK